jgi:hypothetical protein
MGRQLSKYLPVTPSTSGEDARYVLVRAPCMNAWWLCTACAGACVRVAPARWERVRRARAAGAGVHRHTRIHAYAHAHAHAHAHARIHARTRSPAHHGRTCSGLRVKGVASSVSTLEVKLSASCSRYLRAARHTHTHTHTHARARARAHGRLWAGGARRAHAERLHKQAGTCTAAPMRCWGVCLSPARTARPPRQLRAHNPRVQTVDGDAAAAAVGGLQPPRQLVREQDVGQLALACTRAGGGGGAQGNSGATGAQRCGPACAARRRTLTLHTAMHGMHACTSTASPPRCWR